MNQFAIYKRLPIFLQNLLCTIQGYRLEKQRYNTDYYTIYDSLLESDKWNSQHILSYKEDCLNRIIEYAFKHCPYYKQQYTQLGLSPRDLKVSMISRNFPF